MSWKLKLGSTIKSVAVCASVFTMCTAPLAHGAAAKSQKQLIKEYLKGTGLVGKKKMTVGEFYRMVRPVYPQKLRMQMDHWVALNRHQMMPSVEASSFKGSDGKEQVRLTLTSSGQSLNLTFTGDEDKPLKVNGVSLTSKELKDYNKFNQVAAKLAKLDPAIGKALKTGKQSPLGKNFILTYKEFSHLTARQKAEYFVRMRSAAEAAQRVYTVRYGAQAMNEIKSKYEWAYQFLFGEDVEAATDFDAAEAGLTGKPCIVAGYLSIYGENGSCGGSASGAADLKRKMEVSSALCSGGRVSCNPMVYGFTTNGAPHCVERREIKYATKACNAKAPLRKGDPKQEGLDKKAIIESYLKKVKGQDINLILNEDGKISKEQYDQISAYLGDLQGFINSAVAECGQAPLLNIQKAREDQVSACNEIKTRAFSLQSFVVDAQPLPAPAPVPPVVIAGGDCDVQKPGSEPSVDGKSCMCPVGTEDSQGGSLSTSGSTNGSGSSESRDTCGVLDGGAGDEGDLAGLKDPATVSTDANSCGFWCRNKNWIVPVGVGVLGLGLLWWLFNNNKSKSKERKYVPPATPANPGTPTTPVTEGSCGEGSVWNEGYCVPNVVVAPDPAPASEGGAGTGSAVGGGVR